jgi:hypothetical protein
MAISYPPVTAPADAISLQVCAENGSYTIADGVNVVILEPVANRNRFTMTMPAAPANGSSLVILGGNFSITNLILLPNSGQEFVTGASLTTLAVGGRACYEYNASTSRWYRRV